MITPGDRVPFFYGMTEDRRFFSSEEQAGRTSVLILGGAMDRAALDPLLAAVAQEATGFQDRHADLMVLVTGLAARAVESRSAVAGMTVVDCNAALFTQCDATTPAVTVLIADRNLRVTARRVWDGDDPAAFVAELVQAVAAIAQEPAQDCRSPAPLLTVPNVFDRAFCRQLIDRFEAADTFESGVTGIDSEGQTQHRLDAHKKRRRDCLLPPEDALYVPILDRIFRRVAPEIRKAFQHGVTHADRVLIARYDDTGGYFRRHRDNSGLDVAFRQFALSINLNAEDYEGGSLLFPEFNDHRYAPPTGGALVFSASLLHEVTPVTRGQRYVLLTFLHDTVAEVRRLTHEAEHPALAPAL